MQNRILVFTITILLASMILRPVSASIVYTISDEGNDGYVRGCNCGLPLGEGTYEEAHDSAFAYTQSPLDLYVGQMYSNQEYFVWRSYLSFNTSNIPNVGMTSVILKLYGEPLGGNFGNTDFTVHVREWTSNNSKPVNEDYYAYASEDLGTFNTALYNSDSNNDISLNLSAVTAGGITRLCLVSSRDLSAATPTGNEYVLFTTLLKPVLIITLADNAPTPEFPSYLILSLLMVTTMLAVIAHKRKRFGHEAEERALFHTDS